MNEQQDKQKAIEAIGREGFAPFPTDANRFGRRSPKHPGAFLTPNVDEVRLPYSALIDPGTYMVKLHVSAAELPIFLNPITKERLTEDFNAVVAKWGEKRRDEGHFGIFTGEDCRQMMQEAIRRIFPEEAPTDADPTGGAHA